MTRDHGYSPDSLLCRRAICRFDQDAVTHQLKFDGPRMLVAKDFDMMDKDHINLIKLMGITTEVIEKGKIQLNFDPKLATSDRSAAVSDSDFCSPVLFRERDMNNVSNNSTSAGL